jgi:hypothetical protein
MPGHGAGNVPVGEGTEIVLVLVVVLVLESLFRPQHLVIPNTVTGDLTGGRGFTLHKTIEDEDDDEYEDEKEGLVPRSREGWPRTLATCSAFCTNWSKVDREVGR